MSRRHMLTLALSTLLVLAPGAARSETTRVDWTAWQALLDRYVVAVPSKSKLPDTRFDYEQLYVDDNFWRLRHSRTLEAIHRDIFAVSPAAMDSVQRQAWAINAYNFLVVEKITANLLIPGRKFMRYRSPREITGAQGGFYEAYCVTIDGVTHSLRSFERSFVRGDTTAPALPRLARDPRLNFATCAGMVGSPPLAPQAYRAESLDRQLDEQVRRTLAQDRFLRIDPETRRIWCGYALHDGLVDFGGTVGLWQFLEARAPAAIRKAMARANPKVLGGFVPIDERTNQLEHGKPGSSPSVLERKSGS